MDKLYNNNGFSLMECLIVIFIISILAVSIPPFQTDSLSIFIKSLQMRCIQVQEQAFAKKEETHIHFKTHSADFNGLMIQFPKNIVCDTASFHYNTDGNISKGGHVTCKKGNETIQLVFQIGAGRVRVQR